MQVKQIVETAEHRPACISMEKGGVIMPTELADLPEKIIASLDPSIPLRKRPTISKSVSNIDQGENEQQIRRRKSLILQYEKAENQRRKSFRLPEETDRAAKRREYRFLINPKSDFSTRWDIFVGLLIIYSVVMIPFSIGYALEKNQTLTIFDWIVDVFFLADMIVQFSTAFENEQEEMITDWKRISARYLRTWFPVDFISTIPIDTIVKVSIGDSGDSFRSIKMIRVVRLVKLLKLVRVAKLVRVVTALEEV